MFVILFKLKLFKNLKEYLTIHIFYLFQITVHYSLDKKDIKLA